MLSNLPDYQSVIEKPFLGFLLEQGASHITRKNYRTDMQKFMSWIVSAYRIESHERLALTYVQAVTPEVLERYKTTQVAEQVPIATINRRLSALRIFFTCALIQKWRTTNPTTNMRNIPKKNIDVTASPADAEIQSKNPTMMQAAEISPIEKNPALENWIPDRAPLVRDDSTDSHNLRSTIYDLPSTTDVQVPIPTQPTHPMSRFIETARTDKQKKTDMPTKISPLAAFATIAVFTLAFVGSGVLVRQILEMKSQDDMLFSTQTNIAPDVLGSQNQIKNDSDSFSKIEGKTFAASEPPKTSAQSLISALDESATASGLTTLGAFITNDGLTVQFTKNTTLNNSLAVLGDTLLGPTSIAGILAVDSTVHIGGEGIESFGDTLYIQKNKLGAIDFMSGAVSIDTLGKMFADTLQVKSLSTQDISIAGSLTVANAAKIGQASILPGRRKTTVATTGVTSQSAIFLTLTSSSGNQTPYVIDKQTGISFTVSVDDVINEEVKFNWLIIN